MTAKEITKLLQISETERILLEGEIRQYKIEKCREQRELCASNAIAIGVYGGNDFNVCSGEVDTSSILNAPEPEF